MKSKGTARLAHVALIAVVLVWGTSFSLVKRALDHAAPLSFNLVRMVLATVALVLANSRRLRGVTATEWRFGALAGVLMGTGYQLQTCGLEHTTPSKNAFITGLIVVLVPLLSLLPFLRAPGAGPVGLPALGGALLAFGGLVLLTTEPGSGASLFAGFGLGELLTLLCAFAYALHLLTLAHAAGRTDPRRLGAVQIGFAALLMAVTLPIGGPFRLQPTRWVVVALLVTSLLSTAAAFTIQSWAQSHIAATHTALIFTLEPVVAALTSLVFLHERLSAREIGGAALILGGILVAELWPARGGPPVQTAA